MNKFVQHVALQFIPKRNNNSCLLFFKDYLFKTIFLLSCLLAAVSVQAVTNPLYIDLMFSSGKQKTIFHNLSKQFANEHPDITVITRLHEQEKYKEKVISLLMSGSSDVLFGFVGAQFTSLVALGEIAAIDDLWQQQQWDNDFSQAVKSAVMVDMKHYALPLSYYQWGFYYRKSIFNKYNLLPPTTWQEFLQVGRVLKANGITPIVLGSKDLWTVAGWFDYLNLRINGLQFHRRLLLGKVPYNDERVKRVFSYWQELLQLGFFADRHDQYDWRQSLPYLYRGKGGMLLMGNFVVPQLPEKIIEDIGFFRFPKINEKIPFYEEAPLDVLAIPQRAKNKAAAKKFLAFMARKDIQEKMNQQMGMISLISTQRKVRMFLFKLVPIF
ncbi:extracellular solute-binding protein [Psychromonas sp. MME2]|uniref:ABC transporter substrate-binding protein n=1 Tax=Psychromonas sp. MME2 TaxID=3231033 RepID=UPI00339CA795